MFTNILSIVLGIYVASSIIWLIFYFRKGQVLPLDTIYNPFYVVYLGLKDLWKKEYHSNEDEAKKYFDEKVWHTDKLSYLESYKQIFNDEELEKLKPTLEALYDIQYENTWMIFQLGIRYDERNNRL